MSVRGTAPLPVSVPILSIHEGKASWEIGKEAKTDAIAQALLSRSNVPLSLSLGSPITVFFPPLPRAETTWYHKVIKGYQDGYKNNIAGTRYFWFFSFLSSLSIFFSLFFSFF
jgi:hypothetical protein